jgi:hypothetical protein
VGFLVFWGASAVAISQTFDQPAYDSISLAWAVVSGLGFLGFLATWLYGRAAAGRVLLDCGPHPDSSLSRSGKGASTLLCLVIVLSIFTSRIKETSVSKAFVSIAGLLVFVLCAGAHQRIMRTGHLQVRENGIWVYWRLLRWARIGSYLWADDYTLVVRPKSFPKWFPWVLPVPPEQRQAVAEFLAQRCSTQPGAEPVAGGERPGE